MITGILRNLFSPQYGEKEYPRALQEEVVDFRGKIVFLFLIRLVFYSYKLIRS